MGNSATQVQPDQNASSYEESQREACFREEYNVKPGYQVPTTNDDDKDLKCPVCHNYFVPPHLPKELPMCPHVVCEVCIPQLIAEHRIEIAYDVYEHDKKLECPECREKCIPEVETLRTNLRLQNMAEKAKKKKEQQASGNQGNNPLNFIVVIRMIMFKDT